MRERNSRSRGDIVAVIDVGSNSGRVMVFERDTASHLRLLAGSRASLWLVHDVDSLGALSDATMARATEALRDFKAIASSVGARHIVAVATAAMRDGGQRRGVHRAAATRAGIRLEIVGGVEEAHFGFSGAVRGLPVSNGLLFDLGGGSLQITRFANRAGKEPEPAVRRAAREREIPRADPPSGKQLRHLREQVRSDLKKARVPRLGPGDRLVGTIPPARPRGCTPTGARAARACERGDGHRPCRSRARHRPDPRCRDRHEHVADIMLTTDLNGFAHHELALLSSIVRRAGDWHADVTALGLAGGAITPGQVDRAAIILALADEMEARCPHGRRLTVDCTIGRSVTLSVPLLPSWLVKDLDRRFERAFGRSLVIRH